MLAKFKLPLGGSGHNVKGLAKSREAGFRRVTTGSGTAKPVLGAVAVPSLDHQLEFQPFGHALAELGISIDKILNHALLNRLIRLTQVVNDVVN